ncbi:MAG: lasso peptide biosynthesis B2 protein [Persicimonas sp.]
MKRLHPVGQVEMLFELSAARVAVAMFSIERLLVLARRAAERRRRDHLKGDRSVEQWCNVAELLAHRASRLVPGAECLHRALACRVWLARRGIDAEIVVGFRKRGAIEGHAWLEVDTPDGPRTMFKGDEDGYRESFREAA